MAGSRNTTNNELANLILDEIRPLGERVAVLGEMLGQVQQSLERAEYAVFGNDVLGPGKLIYSAFINNR